MALDPRPRSRTSSAELSVPTSHSVSCGAEAKTALAAAPTLPPRPAAERCRGRFWLVLGDTCGLVCITLVYLAALVVSFVVNVSLLLPRTDTWGMCFHILMYDTVIVLLVANHAKCVLTNPGTARDFVDEEIHAAAKNEFLRVQAGQPYSNAHAGGPGHRKWWCVKCEAFRPKHTHHCRLCGSCVLEMDHHCPWMNNCVGWRNHKYFICFIGYALVACIWSCMVLMRTLLRPKSSTPVLVHRWHHDFLPPVNAVQETAWFPLSCVLLFVICMMMAIFNCIMVCDQCEFLARGYGVVGRKQLVADGRETAAGQQGQNVASGSDAGVSSASVAGLAMKPARASPNKSSLGCCFGGGCAKLPTVMGGGRPRLAWFLPMPPRDPFELAAPMSDPFLAEVLRRHREGKRVATSTSKLPRPSQDSHGGVRRPASGASLRLRRFHSFNGATSSPPLAPQLPRSESSSSGQSGTAAGSERAAGSKPSSPASSAARSRTQDQTYSDISEDSCSSSDDGDGQRHVAAR